MLNPVLADLLRAEGQAAFDFGLLNGQASGRAGVRGGQVYANGRAFLGTSGLSDYVGRVNPSNYIWTERGIQYWPDIWRKIKSIPNPSYPLLGSGTNKTHSRASSGSYRRNMFRLYVPRYRKSYKRSYVPKRRFVRTYSRVPRRSFRRRSY